MPPKLNFVYLSIINLKYVVMFKTDKERKLFSDLLDVNWKINNKEYESQEERNELNKQYHILNSNLIKEMGIEEYTRFMEMGNKLFN